MSWRPFLVTSSVATVGTGVLAALGSWGPAVVIASTGAATAALLRPDRGHTDRDDPDPLPGVDALRSAGLEGRPIHLPPTAAATEPRWFVPERDTDIVPAWDGATLRSHSLSGGGAYLRPPGAAAYEGWVAQTAPPKGAGFEEAALVLRRAVAGLGLGTDAVVERRGNDRLRITFRSSRRNADDVEVTEAQWRWPSCSALALLAAAATTRPVRVAAVTSGAAWRIDLDVLP